MPAVKRILLAMNEFIMNHPGFMEGMGKYLLTHPHLKLHTHFFMGATAANRRLLQSMIRHLCPDGVLTYVFWPVADLWLPAQTQLVNISDLQPPDCPSVMSDHLEAGRLAAEHLLEQGLSHYAFLDSYSGYGASCRWQGFRERIQDAGFKVMRFDEGPRRKRQRGATDEALAAWVLRLPKPVGIHTYKLLDAARIAWACQENGLRVPEEVALIGGQDYPVLAAALGPEISALSFDVVKIGYEGMRLLDRMLHGTPAPQKPLLISPLGLIARASSDLRGTKDPEMRRLRQWLRDHAHRPLTVKDILAQTQLSRRTIERRFASAFGHTPHDEICLLRMERARSLLRQTSLALTQVAKQSGFANYMTFNLAFHRANGMTATAFRARNALAAGVLPNEKPRRLSAG